MLPSFAVALIVTFPAFSAVTFPVLLTVAIFLSLLVYVTALFFAFDGDTLVLSDTVSPTSNIFLFADNVMLLTGCVTTTLTVAFLSVPSFAVAVIVAVPTFLAVIFPFEVTVATFVLLDLKVTPFTVGFEGVSVAFTVLLWLGARLIVLALSLTFVTGVPTLIVHTAFLLVPFALTVILAVPFFFAFTVPFASTVATDLLLEVHTSGVDFALLGLIVALSFTVWFFLSV